MDVLVHGWLGKDLSSVLRTPYMDTLCWLGAAFAPAEYCICMCWAWRVADGLAWLVCNVHGLIGGEDVDLLGFGDRVRCAGCIVLYCIVHAWC